MTDKEQTSEKTDSSKPGIFKRLVNKIDQSMKEKADAKAAQGSCCCNSDKDGDKGGKCC